MMAKAIVCDICESNVCNFLLSDTSTGETLAICGRCLPVVGDSVRAQVEEADRVAAAAEGSLPMAVPDDVAGPDVHPKGRRRGATKSALRAVETGEQLAEGASDAADE